jgi:DNA-binding NtrC family response regulator
MEELQSRYFQFVLREVEGNRHRAAKALGLNRRTVQRLIARHGLDAPAETEPGVTDESRTVDESRTDDLNEG